MDAGIQQSQLQTTELVYRLHLNVALLLSPEAHTRGGCVMSIYMESVSAAA